MDVSLLEAGKMGSRRRKPRHKPMRLLRERPDIYRPCECCGRPAGGGHRFCYACINELLWQSRSAWFRELDAKREREEKNEAAL